MKKMILTLVLIVGLKTVVYADTNWEKSIKFNIEHTCKTILQVTNPNLQGILLNADINNILKQSKNGKWYAITTIKFTDNTSFNCIATTFGRYNIKLIDVEFLDNNKNVVTQIDFTKLHN